MSGIMVDANVLVCATTTLDPAQPKDDQVEAARVLLAGLSAVSVAAVAWMEFWRRTALRDAALLKALARKVNVVALHQPASELAARIVEMLQQDPDYCPKCLSPRRDAPCSGCNRTPGRTLRTRDTMILASALLSLDISTLYTFDDGFQKVAIKVREKLPEQRLLKVCAPPAAVPVLPLFPNYQVVTRKGSD